MNESSTSRNRTMYGALFLVIVGVIFFGFSPKTFAAYLYTRSITVTSTTSIASGTNANFPLLVSDTLSSFKSASNGGKIQNVCTASNGGQEPCDLIFATSTTCTSPLNFETESYSSSTGALIDWVNLPSESAGSVIYACYDNSAITTDQSTPTSTWDGYAGVWHFPDGSTLGVKDSTGNGNDGTAVGVSATTGEIDGGAGFNSTVATSSITIDNPSSGLADACLGDCTIQAWIDPTEYQLYSTVIYANNAGIVESRNSGFALVMSNSVVADCPAMSLNVFQDVVFTETGGSTYNCYVNGVLSNATFDVDPGYGTHYLIGSDYNDVPIGQFLGVIDETRIAPVALSPSWITTEYNNESSPGTFLTFGSETAYLPPAISVFSADPSGIIDGATSTLSWTVSGAITVTIDNGLGDQLATSTGSVIVSPTSTTIYTLSANNVNGTTTATTTLTISQGGIYSALSSLAYSAFLGATTTSGQAVTIKALDATSTSWSVTSTQPWLTFGPSSGSLGSDATTTVSFVVDPTGLTLGIHNATATISDSQAPDSPDIISVAFAINSTNLTDSVTQPSNGAYLKGITSLTATATSSVSISSVQFIVDGQNFGSAITSSPYTISWDTTSVSNGSHAVEVLATDRNGNTATSSAITVTVDNEAPSVPTGLTISSIGVKRISLTWASSTDNIGVAGYDVYRNNVLVGSSTGASYTDTSISPDTTYAYKVSAFDMAGNTSAVSSSTDQVKTQLAPPKHPVVFVLEEDNSFSATGLPGSTTMPYLSGLVASSGAVAANDYANGHPSIPGYNWTLTGGADGETTDDCTDTIYNDNIFRQLIAQGLTFRIYIEGLSALPATGVQWVECTNNIINSDLNWGFASNYSDIRNQSAAEQNEEFVDFSQFATDVASGTLPDFSILLPDLSDDSHNSGTETPADTWLQTNMSPLVDSSAFQPGGTGLLMVGWDEGVRGDNSCSATTSTGCGGSVPLILYGPQVKAGFVSNTYYQQPSELRTMMEALGFSSNFPQAAATAPDMSDMFDGNINTNFPSISLFNANSTAITANDTSTLSWIAGGMTSLSIDNGVGDQSATSTGSIIVSPLETTTYTLSAGNINGTTTATTTITVSASNATTTPSSSVTIIVPSGGFPIATTTIPAIAPASSTPSDPTSPAAIQALIASLTAELNALYVKAGTLAPTSFTENLSINAKGSDVLALQKFLNAKGFFVALSGPGSPSKETDFFGAKTKAALAKFQKSVGISPAVGYLGPVTRAYIAAHASS